MFMIYIGHDNCSNSGHFNLLLLNIKEMTLERYEPYGYNTFPKLATTMDVDILKLFNGNGVNIKRFIHPQDYMPIRSIQALEESVASIYKKKMLFHNDPIGYCGVWCCWFASKRLTYPDLPIKELIKILPGLIRQKKDFRTFARNTGNHLLRNGKRILQIVEQKDKYDSNSLRATLARLSISVPAKKKGTTKTPGKKTPFVKKKTPFVKKPYWKHNQGK